MVNGVPIVEFIDVTVHEFGRIRRCDLIVRHFLADSLHKSIAQFSTRRLSAATITGWGDPRIPRNLSNHPHRISIVNHQSSIANHQSPITDHELLIATNQILPSFVKISIRIVPKDRTEKNPHSHNPFKRNPCTDLKRQKRFKTFQLIEK